MSPLLSPLTVGSFPPPVDRVKGAVVGFLCGYPFLEEAGDAEEASVCELWVLHREGVGLLVQEQFDVGQGGEEGLRVLLYSS